MNSKSLVIHFSSFCFSFFLILAVNLTGQKILTPQQKIELGFLVEELRLKEKADQEAVTKYIQQTAALRFVKNEDGTLYALRRIENGIPYYDQTTNRQAAISTSTNHVHEGGRSGFNLMGADMIIGEWDGGGTLTTHVEFEGRAIQRDAPFGPSNHATHVAGTLIAAGINPEAKGMAPEATLWAHDWNSDGSEMAQAASEGLLISNHSYSTIAGWARGDWAEPGTDQWHWWGDVRIDALEDYRYGYYDQRAAEWDRIAHQAPYYLIVKSAGNDRNDSYSGTHMVQVNGEWVESTDPRRVGNGNGFDCMSTYSTAKNILTIGATRNVNGGYSGPSSVRITGFSSYGPTDDGRVKPDIVGDGSGLLSANNSSNTAYGRSSGTSMSGPNVAGSMLLLQELYREMTGAFMRSSSLKGLVLHTADDAGNPGPDYSFGWGLLNTESAAEVLAQPLLHPFFEEELNPSDTFSYSIISDGQTPIRATICWTDPEAQVRPPAFNDRTPRLVNDLDLRVIALSGADSGTVYFPFILDPENPSLSAQTGDNFRDNVEMIDAGILPEGDYLVQVHHKNNLERNQAQTFSLWISAPYSNCNFTLNVDSLRQPLCPNSNESFVVLNTQGASGPVDFYVDAENVGQDSIIDLFRTGKIAISAIDSAGCFSSTDIFIDRPEGLSFGDFDREVARINEPVAERQAFTFSSASGSGWGANTNQDWWRAKLVAADDGSPNPILGCEPLINAGEISGQIAVVRRGGCQFGFKALQAQNAGALACIIINDEPGVIPMAAGDVGNQVTIPVIMIPQADGDDLLDLMSNEEVQFTIGRVQDTRNPQCAGIDDGMINVYTLPTQNDISYRWSNGDSTESLINAAPGTYQLTITDVNGCTYEEEYTLMAPDTIQIDYQGVSKVSCPGKADGSAAAIPSGGQGPYSYLWSSDEVGSEAQRLFSGWNTLSVTDANGCLRIDSVKVPEADSLVLESVENLPSCLDTAVGAVMLYASGGAPYQVLWNDSLTGLSRSGLPIGTYSFRLTDVCGRALMDTLMINEASNQLDIEWETVAADCFGDLGKLIVNVSGGRMPYQVLLSNGEQFGVDDSGNYPLFAGDYTISAFDICGSTTRLDSFQIEEATPIQVEWSDLKAESCPGASDGSINLYLSGGTGSLVFELNPSADLNAMTGGFYQLSILDDNQCRLDTSFTIPSPDTLRADFALTINDNEVVFTNLSEAALDYLWDFGDSATSAERNPIHTYSQSGTYQVCLIITNDCGADTLCQEIEINISSNQDALPEKLKLFPNPAEDQLNIHLPRGEGIVQIISPLGQIMTELPAQRKHSIQVSNWPSGLYLICWEGECHSVLIRH